MWVQSGLRTVLALAVMLTALCVAVGPAVAQGGGEGGGKGGGEEPASYERVLIRADDAGQVAAQLKLAGLGFPITFVADYPLFATWLYKFNAPVTGPDIALVRAKLDDLIASGDIQTGDFDVPMSIERGSGQTGSLWVTCMGYPAFEAQYGIAATGAAAAANRGNGRGVRIGVIDSGLVANAPTSIDYALSYGYDFLTAPNGGFGVIVAGAVPVDVGNGIDENGLNGADEGVGHGTYVSGIVSRVAPGARHLHLRVLDDEGRCILSHVLGALHACMTEETHVVNMSLVPSTPTDTLAAAIAQLRDNGAILVASAGNSANMVNRFLNSEPDLIQVGAVDSSGAAWANSATGAWVDVFAPGVTDLDGQGNPIAGQTLVGPVGFDPQTSSPCYAGASGTSFSAAWVTGAAACFRAANGFMPGGGVAPSQVTTLFLADLLLTAQPIAGQTAWKRLDAGALSARSPGVAHSCPDIVPSYDPSTGAYVYSVDAADMAAVLVDYGVQTGPFNIRFTDLGGDGTVNGTDLAEIANAWGSTVPTCP
jgi:hypothetical protein